MTKHQKLLALDAAIVALEGESTIDGEGAAIKDMLSKLQDHLDTYFDKVYSNSSFEKHVNDQLEAVKQLAKSPAVFGCA